MTTSFLCSTRRFAFSSTISATCTWRSAGSSKVDEITSPCTERCMSVTSSGRSSISSTMRMTSGWLAVIAFAIVCSSIVLPVRGAATIRARWPLPSGSMQVEDAAREVLGRRLHADALGRVERRQVVEEDLVLRAVGRLEVDRVHLDEREVALVLLRRADLAADGVARAQVELADLRRRDVDVVRAPAGSSTRARAGSRSRPAGSRGRPPRRSALPSPPARAGSGRPAPASSWWRRPGSPGSWRPAASFVMPISFSAARSRRGAWEAAGGAGGSAATGAGSGAPGALSATGAAAGAGLAGASGAISGAASATPAAATSGAARAPAREAPSPRSRPRARRPPRAERDCADRRPGGGRDARAPWWRKKGLRRPCRSSMG